MPGCGRRAPEQPLARSTARLPANLSGLRLGVGDRATIQRGGQWRSLLGEVHRRNLPVDMIQIWLPRGWEESWVSKAQLRDLARAGITPVLVHYFWPDGISAERVQADSDAWYASLWRMAQLARIDAEVLVILEPEWNDAPPPGETAITDWPAFAEELRDATSLIRGEAPNTRIGTCPGDFPGTLNLGNILAPVADDLDFIAYQEMRASTAPDRSRPGYLEVGRGAVDFARYLRRAFGRPILLGYVAVSSYGGWEGRQADVLRGLLEQREALRDAGVFGLLYFQLFDDPKHRGFFGRAERHFGLVRSDGSAKPALEVFRQFGDAIP